MEIGRVKILYTKPFYWGWNYYPRKYVKYTEAKTGIEREIIGGIFKVIYLGCIEIRIFNKVIWKNSLKDKLKNASH